MTDTDRTARRMLDLAARAAVRAAGDVEPNPLVGCVIARGDDILGIGHHKKFGDLHAEREALTDCAHRGNDPAGATAYVTLEPCCHTGKQPPCTDALIAAKIGRVVYARSDPAEASKGGAEILREYGIEVVHSDASAEANALAEPWLRTLETGRPWLIAKWAQTLDGRIATRTGESKWISGERSRAKVHRLRARVDAILTGPGTVQTDDPMLDARGVARVRRVAKRVIVDPDLDTPLDRRLIKTAREIPTLIACSKALTTSDLASDRRTALEYQGARLLGVPEQPDRPGALRLDMLLAALRERFDASTVMTECGAGLLGSLFDANLVDEARVYIAPIVMSDDRALAAARGRVTEHLADASRFRLVHCRRLGDDVELIYRCKLG
ncbi:MAG: bifunctional diaminohydroxyphosphoribosylaminopyrimidine deaminase/5-amino-6-(5-phosphoribosylamino)uracil reductase RibD [Planctomycetota bacterium]